MLSRKTFNEVIESSHFDKVFNIKLYQHIPRGEIKGGGYQIENLLDNLVDEMRDIIDGDYKEYYKDFCEGYADNEVENWESFIEYFSLGDGEEFLQTWDYECMKEARLYEWATASIMNYSLMEEAYAPDLKGQEIFGDIVRDAQTLQARAVRIAFMQALETLTVT